ncbi:IS1 family transposase [Aeromonas caviae]|uniref:IS1 family transposase n=1 Tax=Aeromonas caviae TaxID=648 RepID=UPI001942637C
MWYAFDTKRKRVAIYATGLRDDKRCCKLLGLLAYLKLGFTTSDDWDSYTRKPGPPEKHLTGKSSSSVSRVTASNS